MSRDPRFPDRPDHPDFDRMSAAVVANDRAGDLREPIEQTMQHLGVESIDSLLYMAKQRILRASLIPPGGVPPEVITALSALYVDAFALGIRFERDKLSDAGIAHPEGREADIAGQFAVEWDDERRLESGFVGDEEGGFASRNAARAAAQEHAGEPLTWTACWSNNPSSQDEEARTREGRVYFVVRRDVE